MRGSSLIVGNWKCNGSRAELQVWAAAFDPAAATAVLCVPYPYLAEAVALLAGRVAVGCQDLSPRLGGAHTGEVSATMVADCGCQYAIIGHSDCRLAGQDDDEVAIRLERAHEAGLRPILCVGESLAQREAGHLEKVIGAQLRAAVAAIVKATDLIVAYEPVWAIGTGVSASVEDFQEAAGFIRGRLAEIAVDARIQVLYGGSVNEDNAAGFLAQKGIDGLLVGGASLSAAKFTGVCAAAAALD